MAAKKSAKNSKLKKASGKKSNPKASAKTTGKTSAAKSAGRSVGKSASKSTVASVAKTAGKALATAAGVTVAGLALSKVMKTSTGKTDVSSVFSPLDDRIIVEEIQTELRTPGGLFIPDTVAAPEGPKHGKVLAVGRGHQDKKGRLRPLDVKTGDTVLFETWFGHPLKIGDREVIVLRESQLLGLVNI